MNSKQLVSWNRRSNSLKYIWYFTGEMILLVDTRQSSDWKKKLFHRFQDEVRHCSSIVIWILRLCFWRLSAVRLAQTGIISFIWFAD